MAMTDSNSTDRPVKARIQLVDENSVGQRLDNYLLRELKGVPKTRIYRAVRKGEVRVNKGRVKPDYRLRAGDSVRLPPIRLPDPKEPAPIPLKWSRLLDQRVIYEDDGLLVINKPSGLAVHGGSGLDFGMIESLRQIRPQDDYLELVHRLDRDTSGCIMVARKAAVLRDLHRQLRAGSIRKTYNALVTGRWPRNRRRVEAPLKKHQLKSGERMVRVAVEGKPSITEFSVLQRFSQTTLMEARPLTGRTHQIRVHALHAGHPLLGDDKYTDRELNEQARSYGLRRLFLHARALSFTLPGYDKRIAVEAPLDDDLQQVLENLSKAAG